MIITSGDDRIRTYSAKATDLQSVPALQLRRIPSLSLRASGGIRTPDPLITNQLLWPTELHWQLQIFVKNSNFLLDLFPKAMQRYDYFLFLKQFSKFFFKYLFQFLFSY